MFCQQCGAELQQESKVCSVCGAGAPAPRLHVDPRQADRPGKRGGETPPATSSGRPSQAAIAKSQPAYQSPLPRHSARHVAPMASLEVPAPKASVSELLGTAATPPTPAPALPQVPGDAVILPDAPASGLALPTPAPEMPTLPAPLPAAAGAMPAALPAASLAQQTLQGYHPLGWVAPATPAAPESTTVRLVRATTGLTLPRDTPNRVVLGALAALLVSFFLPWLIIADNRPSALSVGWPIILPMLLVVAIALTILLPERALYLRGFLALPLIVGSFFFGGALLLFLLSSAIAANTAGPNFLGVDVGFALFAVASLVLAWAGYYKLLRELPLVLSGRLPLAPLPRFLRALAEKPAAAPAAPAPAAPAPFLVLQPLQGTATMPGHNGHAMPTVVADPPESPTGNP